MNKGDQDVPGDPNYRELIVPIQEVEKTVNDNASEWTLEKKMDVVDMVGEPIRRVALGFRKNQAT